jgi:hypothetical protein
MKLYFAGMDQAMSSYKYEPLLTDHVFGTFFYASTSSRMLIALDKMGHKGLRTIDSGAHSFFGYAGISTQSHHNNKASKKEQMPDPEKYMFEYISWLKKHNHLFDYFVELDIQAIVGIEKVRYWRRRLEREGLWEKCIPCLHSCDTPEQWDETIKGAASKYVGFEGLRNRKVNIPYMKLLEQCYNLGVRVHGFALTNFEILEQYPFWSADSTTWTSTVRYGTFIVRDEYGRMKQKNPSKTNYTNHGINLELHKSKRDRQTCIKKISHSAEKLRESEAFLTRLWVSRGVDWDLRIGVDGRPGQPVSFGKLELQKGLR